MKEPIPGELEKYRADIDRIDAELVDILARRFEIVRAVGRLKAQTGLSVVQAQRAQAVIDRAADMAAEKRLDPDLVRHIYRLMIDHAHALEHDILAEAQSGENRADPQ